MALAQSHFYVLLVLAGAEQHGYAIMREVEAMTEGRERIGPGTLYAALGRLVDTGLVEESDERPAPDLDDARRRYYRITDRGVSAARREAARLDGLARLAESRVEWRTA